MIIWLHWSLHEPSTKTYAGQHILYICTLTILPPFLLMCNFGKQNTGGNISKTSESLTCYRHIRSKFTNHSPLAWRTEGQKVTLVAVIGGFRSDLSITRKTDGNFGNVSADVFCFPKLSINENGGNFLKVLEWFDIYLSLAYAETIILRVWMLFSVEPGHKLLSEYCPT